MNDLLDAALDYARRGWAVVPCYPLAKIPLTENGFYDGSTDAETIRRWWTEEPDANVGVVPGLSGLVVPDVDCKNGVDGFESWRDLELGQDAENTPIAETPHKGAHYYYGANGYVIAESAGKLGPGLDVKAATGFVLAPPSRLPDGEYVWALGHSPADLPVMPLPDKLARLLAEPKRRAPSRNDGRVPQGQRNDWLIRLGGAMRRVGANEATIRAAFDGANVDQLAAPLPETEIERTAQSASRYAPVTAEYLSDLGNGRRFARRHGHEFRFCAGLGGWLSWDGCRWALDQTGEAQRAAKETAISILGEAAECADDDERARLAKWAVASQSANRLAAMLTMAQSEPELVATHELFDADPMLLNVGNGILDLCTGELRPHDPAAMMTKLAPVEYDPNATHPLLDRYLQDVGQGDNEFLAYLQRGIGYSLTGDVGDEVVFLLLGKAGTGKTTLIEALLAILGDYGRKMAFESLLEQRNVGGPRPDLVALRGVRLAAACEASPEREIAHVLLKELSGGDSITARGLYQPEITFRPTHKLWLASNDAPKMRDDDSGWWRRLRRLPFEHVVAEPDKAVKATLKDPETGGKALLAWAVKGCIAWQVLGLGECEIVRRKTSELRMEMDPLAEWFASCCRFDSVAETAASELRESYTTWAGEMGISVRQQVGNREWGKRLRVAGCWSFRSRVGNRQATFWAGIGLVSDDDAATVQDVQHKGQIPQSPLVRPSRGDFPENGICTAHGAQDATNLADFDDVPSGQKESGP